MSAGAWLWLLAVRTALSAAILWGVQRYLGTVLMILAIPAVGVLMAKPILEGISLWIGWASREPYEKWQGNYYEFGNRQVRFVERDGELWIVDLDLWKALGEAPRDALTGFSRAEYGPLPGTELKGFSPAGAAKVIAASPHPDAGKLGLWLTREVHKPHHRKQELARPPTA